MTIDHRRDNDGARHVRTRVFVRVIVGLIS
jgi:hypothetical protein